LYRLRKKKRIENFIERASNESTTTSETTETIATSETLDATATPETTETTATSETLDATATSETLDAIATSETTETTILSDSEVLGEYIFLPFNLRKRRKTQPGEKNYQRTCFGNCSDETTKENQLNIHVSRLEAEVFSLRTMLREYEIEKPITL
jgi:ribonuclease HI